MSDSTLTLEANPEIWVTFLNLYGYEASSLGRIRSIDRVVVGGVHPFRRMRGIIRRLSKINNGYVVVRTTERNWFVHRLVLEAFTKTNGEGMQVCHNNGKRDDNRIENLRWDTTRGNEADKILHGTIQRGEGHCFAKLSNFQVTEILKREGTSKQLAALYSVSPSHIRSIWCGAFRKNG